MPAPRQLTDPTFGPLELRRGREGPDWFGQVRTAALGESFPIAVGSLDGPKESRNPPSEDQRRTFAWFLAHEREIVAAAESALLRYYTDAMGYDIGQMEGPKSANFAQIEQHFGRPSLLRIEVRYVPHPKCLELGERPEPRFVELYFSNPWRRKRPVVVTVDEALNAVVEASLSDD